MSTQSILGTARVKFDFEGAEEEELSIKVGEVIQVLYKDESGWAKGKRNDGKLGWFPLDFVEMEENTGGPKEEEASRDRAPSSATASEADDEFADQNVPESDRSRFNVARELLTTERTYLQCLIKIIKYWLTPLKDGSVIEAKYLPKIFCNVEEILGVSTKLLAELEIKLKTWTASSTIGDAFIQLLPEFVVYIDYLKNHHNAILTVNGFKDRKSFVTWMQSVKDRKEMEGLDLLSFLIMPVQRILRYKLLLEDLLKHTKGDHADRPQLVQTLKQICEIAENVNESIKEEENFQKLCRIQKSFVGNVKNIVADDRKFIREGPVMKVCRKTDKPRWFFLFSDVLVYASLSEKLTGNNKRPTSSKFSSTSMSQMLTNPKQQAQARFLFHRMISLESARVKDVPDSEAVKHAFQIMTTEEKSFTVYVETPQEKEGWISDLLKLTSSKNQEEIDVAPVWIPDKLAKECMICAKGFNVVQRRHHCRNCGKVVCGGCSSQKIKIAHSADLARVCSKCFEELKPERRPSLTKGQSVPGGMSNTLADQADETKPLAQSAPELPPKPSNQGDQSSPSSNRLSTQKPLLPPTPPAKPLLPKPPVRPKSMILSPDVETLKKRVEELMKILTDECRSRLESETKMSQELQRLSQENVQLKQEVQELKQLVQAKK